MPEHTKNHLVTAAYLRGWVSPVTNKLRVHRLRGDQPVPASPRSVAYENAWWSKDPVLNAAAEKACSRLETLVPPLLCPRSQWPYHGVDRATLAEFIALHTLRTRAWRRWYEQAREESIRTRSASWDLGQVRFEQFSAWARTDQERLNSFERILGSVATLLASMHWTLLAYDEPLLATSDQPVAPMPLPPADGVAGFEAMPAGGLLETLEIRFALNLGTTV